MNKFSVTASALALALVSNTAGAQVNVIGTATGCFYSGALGSQCAMGSNASSIEGMSYLGGGFNVTVGPGANHNFAGDLSDNLGMLTISGAPSAELANTSLRLFIAFQSPSLDTPSDILVGDINFLNNNGDPRLQLVFSQTYSTFQYGTNPLQSFEFRGYEGSPEILRQGDTRFLGFRIDCVVGGTAACLTPPLVVDPNPVSVPEPSSFALLAAGLFGMLGFARRRKQA